MQLASYIDHTILKPTTLISEVDQLCEEAKTWSFAAVCVPPHFVKRAKEQLAGSSVKVATVIGFPFGYSAVESKIAEVVLAMVDGADEIDMVAHIGAIKNNDWQYIANELNHILPLIRKQHKVLKVIIESGVLTKEEIIRCCDLYGAAGIDYLKTSTGYAAVGARAEDVALMRLHLPTSVKIKASGGIRDAAFARELIEAGAERLGCSASIAIVSENTTTASSSSSY